MPADRMVRGLSRWALFGVGVAVLACGRVPAQAADNQDAAVVPILRERLQRMQAKGAAGPRSEVALRAAMPKIYGPGGDRPLWNPEKLDTLLALIRASAEDGLRPEDYHLEALTQRVKAVAPGADPAARADADLLATDAFCLLLYHLYFGKVDPKSLDPNWNFAPRSIGDRDAAEFVRDALTKNQLREAVTRVRPDHWWYAKARAALAQYRALAEKGGWPSISPGPALKLGAQGPAGGGAAAASRGDGRSLEAAAGQRGLRCAPGRGGQGLPGPASPDLRRRRRRRDAGRAERFGRGAGAADPHQSRARRAGSCTRSSRVTSSSWTSRVST